MEQMVNPEQRMLRYLLGELSTEEQLEVEAEYFADPGKFDQLRVIEHDLIEGYVSGKISDADRVRFERHYMNTPARYEQVQFLRALAKTVPLETKRQLPDPAPAGLAALESVSPVRTTSWWHSVLTFFRGPQLALGAAILILVAGGTWQMVELTQLRQRVTQIEGERATFQEGERQLKQQIDAQREQNDQLTQKLKNRPEQPEVTLPSTPAMVSATWTISGLRDANTNDNIPRRLSIPTGTDSIRLTFNLPTIRYNRYRIALQTLAGEEIWSRDRLKANRLKSGSSLVLNLPAKRFQVGHYSLVLSGNNAAGESMEIGEFYIEVNH